MLGRALLVCLLVAGCQAPQGQVTTRDSNGVTTFLSQWRPITGAEADLDLARRLPALRLDDIERRDRDNTLIQNRFTPSRGHGAIHTERTPFGRFGESTERNLRDPAVFQRMIAKTMAGRPYRLIGEPREIRHAKTHALGHYVLVGKEAGLGRCFFAFAGYRLGKRHHSYDGGYVDTILTIDFCRPDIGYETFEPMLSSLGLNRE